MDVQISVRKHLPLCKHTHNIHMTHTRNTHTNTQVVASMDVLASARQAVDVWAPLSHHPALVGLRRAFVTSDYDPHAQPALCFAYDFHAGKSVEDAGGVDVIS